MFGRAISDRYIRGMYRTWMRRPGGRVGHEPPRGPGAGHPRSAGHRPDARVRAAQAAQRPARRLPHAVLRLALPGAAPAHRGRAHHRGEQRHPAPRPRRAPQPHRLPAHRGRPSPTRRDARHRRAGGLGGRGVRRPVQPLRHHRRPHPAAHPRGAPRPDGRAPGDAARVDAAGPGAHGRRRRRARAPRPGAGRTRGRVAGEPHRHRAGHPRRPRLPHPGPGGWTVPVPAGGVHRAGGNPRPVHRPGRRPRPVHHHTQGARMSSIRVAIVGVGNCASSLVQGVQYYADADPADTIPGLMHVTFGDYHVRDVEFVAAFDVDAKKVGRDLAEAINASENNTIKLCDVPTTGVTVQRGPTLDGLGLYYADTIEESDAEPVDAGVAFVNALPVFIAGTKEWADKFTAAGVPIVGDDIKSQVGATITHRVLAKLFEDRGVRLERTYQLNVGGNMDFKNMLQRDRLESKKISKTQAVTSNIAGELAPRDVHIGPSDYVEWLDDRKWAYVRLEGKAFGDVPLNLEYKL